ncbi:MAG TPA: hypothetical protein VGB55_04180, partial [Tepidisphaeraceae bacterium]
DVGELSINIRNRLLPGAGHRALPSVSKTKADYSIKTFFCPTMFVAPQELLQVTALAWSMLATATC